MEFEQALSEKEVFIFGLDNEIYPEKDYLLQVYYLFAHMMEYTEQLEAAEILKFMSEYYLNRGEEGLFAATADKFSIPVTREANLNNLRQSARLPLKLLLYKEVLSKMQTIVQQQKKVVLLVPGDPAMQLNKIRQIEWNGLENHIKVYFLEELSLQEEDSSAYISRECDTSPEALYWCTKKN